MRSCWERWGCLSGVTRSAFCRRLNHRRRQTIQPITVIASPRDLAAYFLFPFRRDVVTSFRSPDIPRATLGESVRLGEVWRGAAQDGWNSQAIMCVPNLLP